jgi:hypothetical protein
MPTISFFYGNIIRMYYLDNKEHKMPHIHVEYQDDEAVIQIPEGLVLAGNLPQDKLKLVQAWVIIHKEDLLADWKLAVSGKSVFKIEGLR